MILGFCITVLIILLYIVAYLAHIDSWADFPTALVTALYAWVIFDGVTRGAFKGFKYSN